MGAKDERERQYSERLARLRGHRLRAAPARRRRRCTRWCGRSWSRRGTAHQELGHQVRGSTSRRSLLATGSCSRARRWRTGSEELASVSTGSTTWPSRPSGGSTPGTPTPRAIGARARRRQEPRYVARAGSGPCSYGVPQGGSRAAPAADRHARPVPMTDAQREEHDDLIRPIAQLLARGQPAAAHAGRVSTS